MMSANSQISFDAPLLVDATIPSLMKQILNKVCTGSLEETFEDEKDSVHSYSLLSSNVNICNTDTIICQSLCDETNYVAKLDQETDHVADEVEEVVSIFDDMLDVVETVESILQELDHSLGSSTSTSNGETSNFSDCNVLNEPYKSFSQRVCKEKFTHIISSSFPTTTVCVPFNFAGSKMLSYSTYNVEFQLNVHDVERIENTMDDCSDNSFAECDSVDAASLTKEVLLDAVSSIPEDIVGHHLNQAFIISDVDDYCEGNILQSHILLKEDTTSSFCVKVNDKKSDSIIVEEHSSQSVCASISILDESKRLDQTGCSQLSSQKSIQQNSLSNLSAFSANANGVGLPVNVDIDMVDTHGAMTTHDKAINKSDNDLEECSTSIDIVSSCANNNAPLNNDNGKMANSSENTSKVDCFSTSTPIDRSQLVSLKIEQTSSKFSEEILVKSSNVMIDEKSSIVKTDESWFKFVNSTGANQKCIFDNHFEQPMEKIDRVKKDLSDEDSRQLNNIDIHLPNTNKPVSSQKLNLSLSAANAISSQVDIFNDSLFGNASDMEKLLEVEKYHKDQGFEPSQDDLRTNEILVSNENDISKHILVNTASGQLVMRCPSLTDSASSKVVEWKPMSWQKFSADNEEIIMGKRVTDYNEIAKPRVNNELDYGQSENNRSIASSSVPQSTSLSQSNVHKSSEFHVTDSRNDATADVKEDVGDFEAVGMKELQCVPEQHNVLLNQTAAASNGCKTNLDHQWNDCDSSSSRYIYASVPDSDCNQTKPSCTDTSIMDWSRNDSRVTYDNEVTFKDVLLTQQNVATGENGTPFCSHIVPGGVSDNVGICEPVLGSHIDQEVPNNDDILHKFKPDERLYDETCEVKKEVYHEEEDDEENEDEEKTLKDDGLVNYDGALGKKLTLSAKHSIRRPVEGPDRLYPIFPLKTCDRPRRIGLSRRRKITSLHKDYKPYGAF